jgi:hypothetical protein
MVGWLARSSPLSGSEPQQSLSKGSSRRVSESFWSSYPQAIWKTRCLTSERSEWRPLLFRHSGTHSEMAQHKPNSLSILESHTTPASEVMRPPSKAAWRARAVCVSKRIVVVAQSCMREPFCFGQFSSN